MSTFPHSYLVEITPPPSPPPQAPPLNGAENSQATSKKVVNFCPLSHVREFGALAPSLDNQVVVLRSNEHQAPSMPEEKDIGIITEYMAHTYLDEKIAPSRKKKGVVHTNPYDIKEIKRLFNVTPFDIGTLIKNRKLLLGKLEHVYSSNAEEFKYVIRASIVEYENRILQAEPAIQPYLQNRIGTLSLEETEQFFDALSFRLDHTYSDMSESFKKIAEEALSQYTDRIDEIETDMLVETSSEEEDGNN